eukprot:Skav216761  [mRNA]  locus=scaffold1917:56688:62493:- [translate_table: standard]
MALGFNHRAESMYRCCAENPENPNVMDAKARGLRKVRVLHERTPDAILDRVVSLLNAFHEGSAENHFDVMNEVPVATGSQFIGRGLTFVFSKGGQETSRLMNLVNLPMDSSAVVKKMTKVDVKPVANTGGGKSKAKDMALAVKDQLSQIPSLGIQLKSKEVEGIERLKASGAVSATAAHGTPAASASGTPTASSGDAATDVEHEQKEGTDQPEQPDPAEPIEPSSKKQKLGKVERKKAVFKGYDEEKAVFSTMAVPLSGTDSRPLTALDDVVCALNFILKKLVDGKVIDDPDAEPVLGTYGFCMCLFFEFAFTGKVATGGREYRQYSSLRTELQQLMIDGLECVQTQSDLSRNAADDDQRGEAKGSVHAKGQKYAYTPLELAELLTKNFLDKPVTSVIWDAEDPDEIAIKNICDTMTLKKEDTSWFTATLQCLRPIENLMEKIASDHEKAKEKAEKTAKTLVQTAVRKTSSVQTKDAKKRKKDAGPDPVAKAEVEAALAAEALDKASQSQQQEESVKAAVEKALAACKPPTHINLTVLNKSAVDVDGKTAGTAAMEAKLMEAKARVLAAKNNAGGGPGQSDDQDDMAGKAVGLQAAIVALRRRGSLAPAVKKNKGPKNMKEIESEMRKFGKHLLK